MKITITYNRFLDPIFIEWIKITHPKWKAPSHKEVIKRVKNYNTIWNKDGDKVVRGIEKALGLTFKRTLIPVYVVSGNPRAFSDPFVIKSGYTDKEFLNIMMHELVHCIMSDNNIKTLDIVSRHIPVYAAMFYVFNDVLKKPNLFIKKFKKTPVNEDYVKALKIVVDAGYKTLL